MQELKRNTFTTSLDDEEVSLEVSDIAKQANAAVIGKHGETVVLATVVIGDEREGIDYFPLTVDFEERFYAVGKILGGRFMRREGRPSDDAVLSGRLIDRTIRPLFDMRLRRAIQVTITILAYDEVHDPDMIALLATSAALSISDIPWNGPVAGVFGAEGKAFFAGSEGKINMIEFEGSDASEEKLIKLFETAQGKIDQLIDFQKDIVKKIGKKKIELTFTEPSAETKKTVQELVKQKLETALENKALHDLERELTAILEERGESREDIALARFLLEEQIELYVKNLIITKKQRIDGRSLDEVRPLYAEVGLFNRTHGSALFMRGDTQILSITTLAPPSGNQLIETMKTSESRRFMLHYNFPNFSVGEAGRSRGPGRRDIGHGTLARKALSAVIPSKELSPYTIRVVAETLSSNGSSSMATVCATSLSLMDAGVNVSKHVAGIAMGLAYDEKSGAYEIMTDIQGPEDHYGDMDLKVAGTEDGINALQMDVKVSGITKEMFEKALPMARKARLEIIKVLKEALAQPRDRVSSYAPTILLHSINPDKIGALIGPGGKTINGIIAAVGEDVSIDIDEDGTVFVASVNKEHAEKALELVKGTTREFSSGEIVDGTVIKLIDFGAIVDLGGGQTGMIHVSELKDGFVDKVSDVVKEGDAVRVKVKKVERGKIGLSIKDVPS